MFITSLCKVKTVNFEKLANAFNYIKASEQFDQITLIGDTYHDCEVANVIGCNCILVNNGHQNLDRFNLNDDVKIINNLSEIKNIFTLAYLIVYKSVIKISLIPITDLF